MRVTPLLILFSLLSLFTVLPSTRASPLYHLGLNVTGPDRGYAGSTALLASFLRNDGLSWLNVSVHFTASPKPFALPQFNIVIAPGALAGRGDHVAIPPGYSPGNYAITAKADYQYFDNSTGRWRTPSDSPINGTATLVVNHPLSTAFFYSFFLPQLAPFATASGLAGIIPLLLIRKRTRSMLGSKSGTSPTAPKERGKLFQIVTSVWAPISLLFVALIEPAFTPSLQLGIVLAESLAFSAFVLATVIALTRRKYNSVLFLSVLFLALSATLFSTLPTTTYQLPTYLPGSIGAGFPFQWYTQSIPQVEFYCPPGSLCPIPWFDYAPHNPLNILYLLVDIAFHGAVVVGAMTAYNASVIVSRRLRAAP